MMNFIEEYDGVLDRTFTIPELAFEEDEDTDSFLSRNRPAISRAIAVAVEFLIELEAEEVPAFAVKNTVLVFNLSRSEAGYSIDQSITYFTEIEDYEKCAKLLNLKSKL